MSSYTMKDWLGTVGIGRPGETNPRTPNPNHRHLFRSVYLSRWGRGTFRLGWVLGWDGLYWHRAIGIKGPRYWTYSTRKPRKPYSGPPCWKSHGPLATCSWRRRGSLRSDRQFARNMECDCPRTGLLWPIGFTHLENCPITVVRKELAEEESQ